MGKNLYTYLHKYVEAAHKERVEREKRFIEENDDFLGIKIKRSNQTIKHRDYKDRNKFNN